MHSILLYTSITESRITENTASSLTNNLLRDAILLRLGFLSESMGSHKLKRQMWRNVKSSSELPCQPKHVSTHKQKMIITLQLYMHSELGISPRCTVPWLYFHCPTVNNKTKIIDDNNNKVVQHSNILKQAWRSGEDHVKKLIIGFLLTLPFLTRSKHTVKHLVIPTKTQN